MRRATSLLLLPAVLLMLPALAPAQDGDKAKKLFRAMEEKLTRATSLSLSCRTEVEKKGGEHTVVFKGTVAVAEGDRVHLEAQGKQDGPMNDFKVLMVSDGKRVRVVKGSGAAKPEGETFSTRKNTGVALVRTLSRPGLCLGLSSSAFDFLRKEEIKPGELFPVSDFKLGGKDKVGGRAAQVLTYRCTVKSRTFDVTVWIDTQTHLPLKRVATDAEEGADIGRLVEIYTDVKTGAKVDAKQFELPK